MPTKTPPAPAARCRTPVDPRHKLYARKALGTLWQARVWLPLPLGSINLGLYATEREAHAAARAFVRRGADPVEHLPEGVLPKYVRRVGEMYLARVKTRRGVVALGPFACPKVAHRAITARMARLAERPAGKSTAPRPGSRGGKARRDPGANPGASGKGGPSGKAARP